MAETSKVSFKRVKREPMCAYCEELAASYIVVTEAGEYPACARCQEAVENGLHQCDYTCEEEHALLWQMPEQPTEYQWEAHRKHAGHLGDYRNVPPFEE